MMRSEEEIRSRMMKMAAQAEDEENIDREVAETEVETLRWVLEEE